MNSMTFDADQDIVVAPRGRPLICENWRELSTLTSGKH
jgi:hypothetical protein